MSPSEEPRVRGPQPLKQYMLLFWRLRAPCGYGFRTVQPNAIWLASRRLRLQVQHYGLNYWATRGTSWPLRCGGRSTATATARPIRASCRPDHTTSTVRSCTYFLPSVCWLNSKLQKVIQSGNSVDSSTILMPQVQPSGPRMHLL